MKGVFVLLGIVYGQFGASQEELDLFDLVEDVNANFYDFLGVEQVSLTLLNYELGWISSDEINSDKSGNYEFYAQKVELEYFEDPENLG